MEYLLPLFIILIFSSLIAWRWVVGIDYMHKNHPDYNGEDLFGEDDDSYTNK